MGECHVTNWVRDHLVAVTAIIVNHAPEFRPYTKSIEIMNVELTYGRAA